MSSTGGYTGDDLAFDLGDEGEEADPLDRSDPSPLDAVLLAWAIANSPGPFTEFEDFEAVGRRILVVEDDRASRTAIARVLTKIGCDVVEAGTLAQGIEGLTPLPACVVLDLMLPDGDGTDLLRLVRESGWKTRVVIATGVSDRAILDAVEGLSPDSLHFKPVDLGAICRDCLG